MTEKAKAIQETDFRIGNLVQVAGEYAKVTCISELGLSADSEAKSYVFEEYQDILPITLTPEILLSCGFEKETKKSSRVDIDFFDVYTLGVFTYNTAHGHFWISNGHGWFKEPKCVHQLQNLYFAIRGEELDISLTNK